MCDTSKPDAHLIRQGRFREDLYYRINEATIVAPPLRERQGDPVVLARAFLTRFAAQHKRVVKTFSPKALAFIEQYEWPGNVRELENRVKRAVVMADGREITPADLELDEIKIEEVPFGLREMRERAERQAIKRAMHFGDSNLSRASELLGITRPTLYNLLRKYKIPY